MGRKEVTLTKGSLGPQTDRVGRMESLTKYRTHLLYKPLYLRETMGSGSMWGEEWRILTNPRRPLETSSGHEFLAPFTL